jgi:hypothetical protein
MSNQTTVDEDCESQTAPSLLPTTQRASQSELLTKIYYPDTLYPDNYSFFTDRGDTASSRAKSPLPMDSIDQYPTTTTDPTGPPTSVSTVPKHTKTEIEITDRQSKYPVSSTCFFYFSFYFIVFPAFGILRFSFLSS